MTTVVATLNMRNTAHPFVISTEQAERGLVRALTHPLGPVDLIGLQEWAGSFRNRILRKHGRTSFWPQARRVIPGVRPVGLKATGYTWVRPVLGGPWVGAEASRYAPRWVRSKTLAPASRLERVPGFRSRLGASKVTVACFHDYVEDEQVVVIDGHLTRHVEKGGHYRAHLPKTTGRHRHEVAALERVIAYHQGRGRRVFVTVDGNYDGLELDGLTPCWDGHPKRVTGGTLGARRPDVIYADDEARSVGVLDNASDHDAVVARYAR